MSYNDSKHTLYSRLKNESDWMRYRFDLQHLLEKSSQFIYPEFITSAQALYEKKLNRRREALPQKTGLPSVDVIAISQFFNLFEVKPQQTESVSSTCSSFEEEEAHECSIEDLYLHKKRKRHPKQCTNCPHPLAKHYAKNMCSNCYHLKGRNKKPWKCPHALKSHYALGLCQNCYQTHYAKSKRETSSSMTSSNEM